MKKLSVLLLSAILLLTGCGSSIPDGKDQETYDLGIRAIEIIEKYNNAEISSDDCHDRLDKIYDSLDNLELEEDYTSKNLFLKIYIQSYTWNLVKPGGDTYEQEKNIKETLGME